MLRSSRIEQLRNELRRLIHAKQQKEYFRWQQESELAMIENEIEQLESEIGQIEQAISDAEYQL